MGCRRVVAPWQPMAVAVCILLLAEGGKTLLLPMAPVRVATRAQTVAPTMCAGPAVSTAMPPETAVEVLFRAARAGSDRPQASEATEALASLVRLTTENCNKKQATPETSEVWGKVLSGKTWRPFFSAYGIDGEGAISNPVGRYKKTVAALELTGECMVHASTCLKCHSEHVVCIPVHVCVECVIHYL